MKYGIRLRQCLRMWGSDNGGILNGSLVVWDLGVKAEGTSGTVKVWVRPTSYPYWPVFSPVYVLKPDEFQRGFR